MEVNKKSKIYQVRRVSPRVRNTTQSKWNSFLNRNTGSLLTGLEELLELVVEQSNLYAHENGRNFTITKEELKELLGIKFLMATNKFLTIAEDWRVNNLIGNDGIQSTMIRSRFCEIFQNLRFADNRKNDKTDKAFKMRPVIDHLNSNFPRCYRMIVSKKHWWTQAEIQRQIWH